MATFLKAWKNPYVRGITSLAILGTLLATIPIGELWSAVRSVSSLLWFLVVVGFVGGHFIGALKWRLFINLGTKKVPYLKALRFYFAGLFANFFLPSVAGGDFVRGGLAIRFCGEKEAIIFGSILDRCIDVMSLGILVLFGAFYSPRSLEIREERMVIAIFAMGGLLILGAAAFFIFPTCRLLPARLEASARRIRDVIKRLVKSPERAIAGISLAILIQGGFVLLNAVLGSSCGINIPLQIWFLAWPLAKIAAMLPVSLGGLGVREVALAFFLERFDVPFSQSVALGLLWESVLVAGAALGGISLVLLWKRNSRKSIFSVHDRRSMDIKPVDAKAL